MNHYFTAARDLFWKQMVGENQTEDHITENLNFSPTAAGTEFTAAFRPEDFSVIGADGTLLGGRKETKTVKIFLDIQGGEEKRSYETEVTVYPEERSEEEELEDYIKGAEGVNRAQEIFELPQEFKGDRLSYEEKKKESVWPLAAICIILLPGIMWYMPVQKQKEALKRRERQLLEDYPDLVLKFSLLLKAGLTIRNVWQKIGEDYDREVNRTGIRYAYEEIWQSACRMKAGVPEREEYQNFGMRCGLHPYLRLSALLEQNLQKGNKSLLSLLQGEQIQAFEERKNQIRKLGEEAGTKLLGPMMLYFLIVLMILLIPAWLSFSI